MSEPTIALALGAGGARGLAHIAALEAFDELGIKPVALAGSSIGSVMSAAYASGMSGLEIKEFAQSKFKVGTALLTDLWNLRAGSLREFLNDGGPRLGGLKIERVMDVFLPDTIPQDFDALSIPTQIIATDYFNHQPHTFSSGNLRLAMAASSTVPAIFSPVMIDGTVYIDGGITNPVPFDVFAGKADIIMGIDVAGGPTGTPGTIPGTVDVLYAASQLMQQSIARAMAEHHKVDVFLRPSVGGYRVLDFMKSNEIIEATRPFRDEVKRAIEDAVVNWDREVAS